MRSLNKARRSHIAVLVLPVGLAVVTDNPIRVSRWRRFAVLRCNLSVYVVVIAFEQTRLQVQISNRVDSFGELHASGQLAIASAPLMFNSFHVPLVDKDNNAIAFSLVNRLEQVQVTLVNKYALDLWEVNVRSLDVPVNLVGVQALLGKCLRAYVLQLRNVRNPLLHVLSVAVLKALGDVIKDVHNTGLVMNSCPCLLVQLGTKEVKLGSNFLRSFAGRFYFETGTQRVEVVVDAEVPLVEPAVESKS